MFDFTRRVNPRAAIQYLLDMPRARIAELELAVRRVASRLLHRGEDRLWHDLDEGGKGWGTGDNAAVQAPDVIDTLVEEMLQMEAQKPLPEAERVWLRGVAR